MKPNSMAVRVVPDKVAKSREFYVRYLGAEVTEEGDGHVSLGFGDGQGELLFMAPNRRLRKVRSPTALMYGITVDNSDDVYRALSQAKRPLLVVGETFECADWSTTEDPNGIRLRICIGNGLVEGRLY